MTNWVSKELIYFFFQECNISKWFSGTNFTIPTSILKYYIIKFTSICKKLRVTIFKSHCLSGKYLGVGVGESLWMKHTKSYLKRFESSKSATKHKRSCQNAWVGFCQGHCCGSLYEKTSQMWLHYRHTPSWREKNNHLQFVPQTGDISAPRHYSNKARRNLWECTYKFQDRGHIPTL